MKLSEKLRELADSGTKLHDALHDLAVEAEQLEENYIKDLSTLHRRVGYLYDLALDAWSVNFTRKHAEDCGKEGED